MIVSKQLLAITAITFFVECTPQDFAFPDDNYLPDGGAPFLPQTRPPRPQIQPPRPQTPPPTRPTPNQITSTLPTQNQPTDGSTTTTTRIPPRDPANRIVYTVSCPCNFTRQYSPVCGTDGQTYGNMGILQCAVQCGTNVQVYLVGACGRNNG